MAKEAGVYSVAASPLLKPILRNRVGALLVNWVFQSLLYMDRTERAFKLALDILIATVVGLLLWMLTPLPAAFAIAVAMLLAHTVNWSFNGQIFVVLKHFQIAPHEAPEWQTYMAGLARRAGTEPSIEWAAAYGSLARGEFERYSDLDVRVIRRRGIGNGVQACWFAVRERSRALLTGYALDIYVLDSPRLLERLRPEEKPVVLSGRQEW